MRKLFVIIGLAFCMLIGNTAKADVGQDILEGVVLYVPNRVLDVTDTFTLNLGVGPIVEAQLMGTHAVWGGAGWGISYKMYKAYNRQYGFGEESGWFWQLVSIGEEETSLLKSTSLVRKYSRFHAGFPTPDERVFNMGAIDYWAIGGSLGGGVVADLFIHPVEWFDLGAGFLLIDVKGDDLTFSDF